MAFAVASKRAPSAGHLKDLCRLAAPSASVLAPASSVAATRRLYSNGYYYYAPPSIGDQLEAEDAVEVKVAMPGLPPERVKVLTNKKGLLIKSLEEGVKGLDDAAIKAPDPYSCQIKLPAAEFDLDKAKAEMKHGLLKVTVPRVKGTDIKIES